MFNEKRLRRIYSVLFVQMMIKKKYVLAELYQGICITFKHLKHGVSSTSN